MTQHTSGPWNQEKGRVCSGSTQDIDCKIAEVYGDTDIQRDADAQLIAAAPDLLAALERLLNVGDSVLFQQRAREAARAAIAKAKGV